MSHSFDELYNLFNNQPEGPDAEIEYFRQNGISAIRVVVQGNVLPL